MSLLMPMLFISPIFILFIKSGSFNASENEPSWKVFCEKSD